MTVKYNVVPKRDPRKLDDPPKYYHASTCMIWPNASPTFSTADSLGMLEALLQVISDELSQGNIVELGDFGTFRLTIRASGEDHPHEVGEHNIRQAKVQFKPGWPFKNVLKRLDFHKV